MQQIKFYSESDMASGWQLKLITEKINTKTIQHDWTINDMLDFYNMLKYFEIENFMNYIVQEINVNIEEYLKEVRQRIGVFIGSYKNNYLALYDQVDYARKDDFFEILERYNLYKSLDIKEFKTFLRKENVHIYTILRFKKIIHHFDELVKEVLLSDPSNAEIILSSYMKEDDLNLPKSLTKENMIMLLDEYIESSDANLNTLSKIINFPTNKGFIIPDKTKLHSKRKLEKEEEKVFAEGTGLETGIEISYLKDQEEAILLKINGGISIIKVSMDWIERNLDYPTLWNNFIYLFEYVDRTMRLKLVSLKSESSALESVFTQQGEHLYYQSSQFRFKEMFSDIAIYSYSEKLNLLDVSLEAMIEWFFHDYIKEEFSITDFIIKMPSKRATYFEKCRTVLPEIDRIIKQYNLLVEEGAIDQELIQMSSSSVRIKDVKSLNINKYFYPCSDWYNNISFLLFSDQSGIFYIPGREIQYNSFFELINSDKIFKSEFEKHQLLRMQFLFDHKIICENNSGQLQFINHTLIFIIKELYFNEVINYWHYPRNIRKLLDELKLNNDIEVESRLFSRNEQNYLDYYLNKSKYSNGHDIRNKYLHGTNTNDEIQYKKDYYVILKLFVIIIIKINDDLCLNDNKMNT